MPDIGSVGPRAGGAAHPPHNNGHSSIHPFTFLAASSRHWSRMSVTHSSGTGLEVVRGYFVYDDDQTAISDFPAIGENFGLHEDRSWAGLLKDVRKLNEEAKSSPSSQGVRYKLVFAARHGEGWHNVAEAKYGTEAWDAKWALLTGDGELTWGPDPELTPLGEDQARAINATWKQQLGRASQGLDAAPLPTKLFSSPFKRSSKTLQLSYEGILLPPGTKPDVPGATAVDRPYVKEDLREQFGNDNTCIARSSKADIERNFPYFELEPGFPAEDEKFKVRVSGQRQVDPPLITEGLRENYRDEHTCDERSTRSEIARFTPKWSIEEGFTEQDELFGKIHETVEEMTVRVANAVKDIFAHSEGHEVIHISSHSGVMESLWKATGHRHFKPATGAIVPLIIKYTPA
ncbi:unnamed protein product [Parajaminaea phylloscopi]